MSELALPEGWINTKLGNYIFLKNGYAFKSSQYMSQDNKNIPLIRIGDIKDRKVSISQEVYVEHNEKANLFLIERGDLLIAMSGATTGKMGVFHEDRLAYQNQRVGNIKLYNDKLGSKQFRNYLIQSLKKTIYGIAYGGAQPNISAKSIENIDFLLPPLAEQKKIAEVLDSHLGIVTQIQARLDAIPKILEKFRQSVLNDAVNGELTKKYSNIETKKSCLKDLGKMIGGKTPSKANPDFWQEGTVNWVSPKDMKVFYIDSSKDKITDLALNQGGMHLIPENSVLMVTRSGILEHSFPVALTLKQTTINQDIKAFMPDTGKLNAEYLAMILRGSAQDILYNCSKDGVTVASIDTNSLLKYQFRVPTIEEQKEIVKRIKELFAYADQIEKSVATAKARVDNLTQSILHQAFTGQLTAEWREQNPELISGDNSAQALLARIQAEG